MKRVDTPTVAFMAAGIIACAWMAAGCSGTKSAMVPSPINPGPKGLQVNPSSISMGPTQVTTVTASEIDYSGGYSESDTCSGVVTVQALGATQFTITGVAPGTCSITISDTKGNSAQIPVSIQTVVIGGQ